MTPHRSQFQAIGTKWDIQIGDEMSDSAWTELLAQLTKRIQSFDAAYSRFRPDSLVTRMSEQAGTYELPPDGYKLLNFYERLYKATAGKVTPLIGQTMVEAGYDAAYSLREKTLHQPPSWQATLAYDQTTITLKQPALLDFGAAGKGYLVDIVGELLEAAGITTYVINAGGDIRRRSVRQKALKVGLENPVDTSEAVGIVELANRSLCASAGSKRKWGAFHHIIDPFTLQSPTDVIATWVLADDTMTADGLATALFFTDAIALKKQFTFSQAVLYEDMSLAYANDFPITVFEAA